MAFWYSMMLVNYKQLAPQGTGKSSTVKQIKQLTCLMQTTRLRSYVQFNQV